MYVRPRQVVPIVCDLLGHSAAHLTESTRTLIGFIKKPFAYQITIHFVDHRVAISAK